MRITSTPLPVTKPLTDEAISGRYVHETGLAITARFCAADDRVAIDPLAVPACLVHGHAPFVWGRTPHEAAHNAVMLEAVARLAYRTILLQAGTGEVPQALLDCHYFRNHGAKATYGQ